LESFPTKNAIDSFGKQTRDEITFHIDQDFKIITQVLKSLIKFKKNSANLAMKKSEEYMSVRGLFMISHLNF
jgi:hypothetical protein